MTPIYYLTVSVGQKSRPGLAGSFALGLPQGCNHNVSSGSAIWGCASTGEGSASKFARIVVDRIQFIEDVGFRPQFLVVCWLEATFSSLLVGCL